MLKSGSFAVGAFAALVQIACGSDGEPTGTVHLALESSGATPATIKAVEVKLAGVDVHIAQPSDTAAKDSEEGGSWLSTNTRPGTTNLLALKDNLEKDLGEVLAHGPITQIRMRFEAMGGSRVVFADGKSCPIDTSALDQTGVRVIHPFLVVEPEDGPTKIVLDFDVPASLIEVGPCAYKLRPVLRVVAVER